MPAPVGIAANDDAAATAAAASGLRRLQRARPAAGAGGGAWEGAGDSSSPAPNRTLDFSPEANAVATQSQHFPARVVPPFAPAAAPRAAPRAAAASEPSTPRRNQPPPPAERRRSPRIQHQSEQRANPSGGARPYARPEALIEDHNPTEGRGIPKPARFNKDLGKNDIVLCQIKNIHPKKPVKEHFPNSYDASYRKPIHGSEATAKES